MLFEKGRVCEKTKGKEKGKKCVVIDVIDQKYVLVDGETKKRRVNIGHLRPLDQTLSLEKGAKSEDIKAALK